MNAVISSITCMFLVLAAPVLAQTFDPTARAKSVGENTKLGAGSPVFTDGKIDEVVTPYQGVNTQETSINDGNIDARMKEVISGDSQASKSHRDLIDSQTLRPKYKLETDYEGIVAADQATINAEKIAGRFFSGSVEADPACNFTDFKVLEPFERFCDVHANIREETCDIDRVVEVDRRDTWTCDRALNDVTISCAPQSSGVCAVGDLPEGNPASQCSFLNERCAQFDAALIRTPAGGDLYEPGATRTSWFNDGVFLVISFQNRSVAMVGEEIIPLHATEYRADDGCTYYRGNARAQFAYGVYRTCPGTGRCLRIERNYRCLAQDQCSSLAQTGACNRTQHGCLTSDPNGCKLERSTYECFNDLSDHNPALRIDSRIMRIEDKLINRCDTGEERNCTEGTSTCSIAQEVRTIMGFPVSRDCWQYKQQFSCLAEGMNDYTDCGPFKADPSCKIIGETCLSFLDADETIGKTPTKCKHWEYQYRCGGEAKIPDKCTAFNVCVGGLCEGMTDESNKDFANAAAWLTMLDEAAKDFRASVDMQNATLFAGTARNCKVTALDFMNCCKDSGWANGIFSDCSEDELALMDRVQAKAAVYVGTYCSKKVLGVCIQKRRSYCTFNSQLGMVFQKEIRRLSRAGWGDVKSPNCAGLRLDEIETIDWEQIDLSEAFVDMMNEASVPSTGMVTDFLRDRLQLTAGAVTDGD